MNSISNLGELPWHILLSSQESDPDSRQVIRTEIIKRCPEFETKLNEDQWNLIHLAAEYGYADIVEVQISIIKTTGNISQLFRMDVCRQMTPLGYAAMKGEMKIIQLLLDALSILEAGAYVQDLLMAAILAALKENQSQAFRALAIKYMEDWDSDKVAIIKTTNKLLMESPRESPDVPTEVFEALNIRLLSAINTSRQSNWNEHDLLEKLLSSEPLLFRALSSRSCPLQTDDLLYEIHRSGYEVGMVERAVNVYLTHWLITWGYVHIVDLVLIYESGSSSVCLLKDMQGETPLHRAVQTGKVRVINSLLEKCWECARMVSDKKNETALHCALRNNKAKAFKILLWWYIVKEEFSENNGVDWECGDTPFNLLVNAYAEILKKLLSQSKSKVCFQREFWQGKDYFVVIKCKHIGRFQTCFEYQNYIREVTSKTTNRTILSFSVDSRSILTLKVLIRSVMVKGILDVKDVEGYTVFGLLEMWTEEVKRKTNLMGFVPYERFENVIWLLDAIEIGDYDAFSKLQVEDPYILDHVCEFPLGGTPLHIAARLEKLNDCTREIIRKRPDFAAKKDHRERNPLHIASAKGHLEIVNELLTQLGFNQCFASTNAVLADICIDGEFSGTPIEYAIENGRITIVNELLSVWWKCVRVANRQANSELLKIAVSSKQLEVIKMLMERYIEDELLIAKEVDGNPMSALADGYIEIVLKHLLSPKVNYSLSILMKNREDRKRMDNKPPLPLYFAVIKVISTSMIDKLHLTSYYSKYFREVTVRNKMVLHLSVEDENSVSFKLLLRSPLFYQIDDIFEAAIFQRLQEHLEIELVENEMGTLLPIWNNKISDTEEPLGKGTKNGHEGVDGNGESNDPEMLTDTQDDYTIRNEAEERANKRGHLDTIHESQIVSKARRKDLIASSSISPNAHLSWSNLSFLEQIPQPMHGYVDSTEDIEKDGHCGYRVVAMQSGYEATYGWKRVRTELLYEVVQNEELYVKLTDIDRVAKMRKAFAYLEDHAADPQYWLRLDDAGYVIANVYKAVVVLLSLTAGNLTFLPLLEPPPEGRPHRIITFGFADANHFISVSLKPDAPIPQVDSRWDINVSESAAVWKTQYLRRFEEFKTTIMGYNLGQADQNSTGP